MIPVNNIYHMLAYAFQILQEGKFKKMETETFRNAADMFAEILILGVNCQIQQGLKREYMDREETLSSPRGKIMISQSIKGQTFQNRQLVCQRDEFTEDCYFNQIVKTTFLMMLKAEITPQRKKQIRNLLVYFKNVRELDPNTINWKFQFRRLDGLYRMILSICEMVIHGLLQTQKTGDKQYLEFIDQQRMNRLYEKFILEYYRKEHSDLKVTASEISWQLDDGFSQLLPVMRSDIMLEKDDKILIIDAKYYQQNLQERFDHQTVHSGNLYQIFTYVKNKAGEAKEQGKQVSGMLLYAKTEAEVQPDQTYQMSGNRISVKSLDLNVPFQEIRQQLDSIYEAEFIS